MNLEQVKKRICFEFFTLRGILIIPITLKKDGINMAKKKHSELDRKAEIKRIQERIKRGTPESANTEEFDMIKETPLEDYLEYCKDNKIDFDVYIIPPIGKFKRYKDAITIFPISRDIINAIDNAFGNNIDVDNSLLEIINVYNQLLYRNKLYNPVQFFKDSRSTNLEEMLERLNPPVLIKLSFSLLSLSTELFNKTKQKYLTPIRKFLSGIGIIDEPRGKNKIKYKIILKERNLFIISAYKDICKKTKKRKPFPIASIQRRIDAYVNEKGYKGIRRKKFMISDMQIRRILQNYIKK